MCFAASVGEMMDWRGRRQGTSKGLAGREISNVPLLLSCYSGDPLPTIVGRQAAVSGRSGSPRVVTGQLQRQSEKHSTCVPPACSLILLSASIQWASHYTRGSVLLHVPAEEVMSCFPKAREMHSSGGDQGMVEFRFQPLRRSFDVEDHLSLTHLEYKA